MKAYLALRSIMVQYACCKSRFGLGLLGRLGVASGHEIEAGIVQAQLMCSIAAGGASPSLPPSGLLLAGLLLRDNALQARTCATQ